MEGKLYVIGVNVHLNVAEQEWLEVMQKMYGATEQEALAEIIEYKREQAFGYEQSGNIELARQLLQEIDEWDDAREMEYNRRKKDAEQHTIIIPEKPHIPTRVVSIDSVLRSKGLKE